MHFQTKVPDAGVQLRLTDLNFRFRDKFAGTMPDAYQRLLLDVMQGDASLLPDPTKWTGLGIIDPISTAGEPGFAGVDLYEAGSWGPSSNEWMARQGRGWFDVCPVLE